MAKVGEGHAAAMLRLGMKELRNAVNPSREGAADNEVGVFLTQTQGEIAQARGGAGAGPEQESPKMTLDDLKAFAKDKAQQAEKQMDRAPERQQGREQGREM